MQYFSVLLAATLTGAVSAMPAWQECPAGTSYFVCASPSFKGCCSVDACHLGYCPDGAKTTQATRVEIQPIASSTSAFPMTSTPAVPKRCNKFVPEMRNVFPDRPKESSNKTDFFWVSQDQDGKNKRNQVMIFRDVPKSSKNCGLSWTVPNRDRNFAYAQTGYLAIQELKLDGKTFEEKVGKEVTYEKVKGLVNTEARLGADTTNWPQLGENGTHSAGSPKACGGDIAFLVEVGGKVDKNAGAVIIGQKEGHGFYITYEC